jgi:hypothetical protein
MPTNDRIRKITRPGVPQISALITSLDLYLNKFILSSNERKTSESLDIKRLAAWDSLDWYELTQDIELIDFLTSGTKEAGRLLLSLQSFVNWKIGVEMDHTPAIPGLYKAISEVPVETRKGL